MLSIFFFIYSYREVVQELTDEYIASTMPDYITRGSAKVRPYTLTYNYYLFISAILQVEGAAKP